MRQLTRVLSAWDVVALDAAYQYVGWFDVQAHYGIWSCRGRRCGWTRSLVCILATAGASRRLTTLCNDVAMFDWFVLCISTGRADYAWR